MPQNYPLPQPAYDPPSPHTRGPSDAVFDPAPPVPALGMYGMSSAQAGPSTGGGVWQAGSQPPVGSLDQDPEEPELMEVPFSPSSAPPTPSVKGTTHPPEFIHTHHPRRGSMTPLGLNVISPRPPPLTYPYGGGMTPTQSSPGFVPGQPQRSVGFNPVGYPSSEHSPTMGSVRRSSATSTASTLTQSRPGASSSAGHRDRRRSSLTPIHPTLAPPSPSRLMAIGRHSRPSSSDGTGSSSFGLHTRTRTEPASISKTLSSRPRNEFGDASGDFGRRGSMPHLAYPAASSSRPHWNPSLSTQRGSVGEGDDPVIDQGYRFGSVPRMSGPSSPAAAALRAIDLSPASHRSSFTAPGTAGGRGDVFAEAEAEEAEKQRRAFIAATYGTDGKRARERLSIGGPGPGAPIPAGDTLSSSPSSSGRRPSLMLWEKLGMGAAHRPAGPLDAGSASAPTLPVFNQPFEDDLLGQRRGSLPIAVPGGGVMERRPSRREVKEARKHDMDAPIIVQTDADAEGEEESEDEEDEIIMEDDGVEDGLRLSAPKRPLPPLLPLSDPGPRLLPSTLALHRASHLLNARNLQPEPLPHPLPPSLHPPAPVDLAEFDIDFILAGSQAQLGGEKKGRNTEIDALRSPRTDAPATPILKLGAGGEDDSFAKFVGQFDDEYGDRRGEWTFRSSSSVLPTDELRDPLDKGAAKEVIKAEWESLGAGKYELYGNGEVRSVRSGSIWRVRRTAPREYELEELRKGLTSRAPPQLGSSGASSTSAEPHECFCLSGKLQHFECGGVKFPYSFTTPRHRQGPSRANSGTIPELRAAQIRSSVNDSPTNPRIGRIGSEDSAATSRAPVSSSLPSAITAMLPRKKRQDSSSKYESDDSRGRGSVSTPGRSGAMSKLERSVSREKDKKKGGGFGGVLKRGLASMKSGSSSEDKKAAKEEKERERMQSQSWSGNLLSHRDGHPAWMHPSGRTTSTSHSHRGTSGAQFFSNPTSTRKSSGSLQTGSVTPSQSSIDERERGQGTSSQDDSEVLIMDEETGPRREGKGWVGVPDDAVAMVVPIESEGPNGPCGILRKGTGTTTPNIDPHRQALLVWFVPFNSDSDVKEDRPALTSYTSTTSSRETTSTSDPSNQSSSSSLPKFQKLLRRRASKEKETLKPPSSTPGSSPPSNRPTHISFSSDIGGKYVSLPFRSFRIVARAIDWDELRCETGPIPSPATGYPQWAERNATLRATPVRSSSIASSSQPSPNPPRDLLPRWGSDESADATVSTAPTSTIGTGRTFPTVIAVCHSRSQGVEFVLEGLDRLGFCQGESAWGPTGYEEWRGTGLSEKGKELLDLLWAGCVAVLGIAA